MRCWLSHRSTAATGLWAGGFTARHDRERDWIHTDSGCRRSTGRGGPTSIGPPRARPPGPPEGVAQWLVMSQGARRRCTRGDLNRRVRRPAGAGQRQDTSGRNGSGDKIKAGDDPNHSASPASTVLGYQACNVGRVGWPRRHCVCSGETPPKRSQLALSAITRPATLLPYRGVLRVGARGTVLGRQVREIVLFRYYLGLTGRPVSPLYYVTDATSRPTTDFGECAIGAPCGVTTIPCGPGGG